MAIFFKRQGGETQLIYALLLALIVVAAIAAVMLFGKGVQGLLSSIHSKLGAVFPGATTTVEQHEEEGEASEEALNAGEPEKPKKRRVKPRR